MSQPPTFSPYPLGIPSHHSAYSQHQPRPSPSSSASPRAPPGNLGAVGDPSLRRTSVDILAEDAASFAQYFHRGYDSPSRNESSLSNLSHPLTPPSAADFLAGLHISDSASLWQGSKDFQGHLLNNGHSRRQVAAGLASSPQGDGYGTGFPSTGPGSASLWSPRLSQGHNALPPYHSPHPQSPQLMPLPSPQQFHGPSSSSEFRSLPSVQSGVDHGEWLHSDGSIGLVPPFMPESEAGFRLPRNADLHSDGLDQPQPRFYGNGAELLRLLHHGNSGLPGGRAASDVGSMSPHMDTMRGLPGSKLTSPRVQHGPIGPPPKKVGEIGGDSSVGAAKNVDIHGENAMPDTDSDFLGPLWTGGLSPRPSPPTRPLMRPSITIPVVDIPASMLSPVMGGRLASNTPTSASPIYGQMREDGIPHLDLGSMKGMRSMDSLNNHHREYLHLMHDGFPDVDVGERPWPIGWGGWESGRAGIPGLHGLDGYNNNSAVGTGAYHRPLGSRNRDGNIYLGVPGSGIHGSMRDYDLDAKGSMAASPPGMNSGLGLDSPDGMRGAGFGGRDGTSGGRLIGELGGRGGGRRGSAAQAGGGRTDTAQSRRGGRYQVGQWVPVAEKQQKDAAGDLMSPRTPASATSGGENSSAAFMGSVEVDGEKSASGVRGREEGLNTAKTPREETPRGGAGPGGARRRVAQQEWRMKQPAGAGTGAGSGSTVSPSAAAAEMKEGKTNGTDVKSIGAAASPKSGGLESPQVLPLTSQLERPGLLSPTHHYVVNSMAMDELTLSSPREPREQGVVDAQVTGADKGGGTQTNLKETEEELKKLGTEKSEKIVRPIASAMHTRESRYRFDVEEITEKFLSTYNSLIPTAEEETRRRSFLNRLDALVAREWPGARLFLFGSCANAFGVCNSDIDVCLAVEDSGATKAELVTKMASILRGEGMRSVQALTHARVPIVKFTDPFSETACDICVNNILAVTNTKLLHDYAQIDERLRQLAFCVKHWAKRRQINETYRGTLSSYAYVLMCIFFLQQRKPAILPCLQEMRPITYSVKVGDITVAYHDRVEELQNIGSANRETLGELLTAFFEYWAFRHDYNRAVISVRTGGYLTKDQKDWTRRVGNERHLICIEDPFEVSHDLGRVVDRNSIRILRDEFHRLST
eukprot:TRINITY_DN14662_c0_g2_i3.p1 TRINITY_DN14662_c0_g2~~TRINITY_DN14662_c0_g2_i3.p1  ORF type:complete len:1149 (-),score=216.24 TRINITY_DN14662_c0_g2_i3:878-4324(-)